MRPLALAAGLFIASLLGLNLPQVAADGYDSSKPAGPAGWSARSGPSKTAPIRPASSGLKWGSEASRREPVRIGPHRAKPISALAKVQHRDPVAEKTASPTPRGPALVAPQVSRALHEAEPESTREIELTSLTSPDDDEAANAFQDELTDEEIADDEGEDGEYDDGFLESDENDSEDALEMSYDAEEVARRDSFADLAPESEEPDVDLQSQPSLEEAYAQAGPNEPERCPSPRDMKPINQIDHRIAAEPGLFPQECALSEEPFQPRRFAPVTFTWKASALAHKPLWFQQPKLERYGHTFGPFLTPIISAGHFFVMVPCLPYNMGMEPPWECVYSLGWYRPGDCAPYTLGPLPLSARGAATQAVVTTGLWFLFP